MGIAERCGYQPRLRYAATVNFGVRAVTQEDGTTEWRHRAIRLGTSMKSFPIQEIENMTQAAAKPSALDALRGLSKKAAPPSVAIAAQVNDPAIAGAKRDKNTVKLGFDPAMAPTAERVAALKAALERAEAEFKVDQGTMRDYGIGKRGLYNDTFKCEITTVCVPYHVEVPGAAPEIKYVQVICSSKYSVQQEIVLGNRELIGPSYERMFEETTVKSLKPNAEELIRNLLAEVAGLSGEDLENTMGELFDTKTTVKATDKYESEFKKLSDDAKLVLDQAVTRSQPALKFPD